MESLVIMSKFFEKLTRMTGFVVQGHIYLITCTSTVNIIIIIKCISEYKITYIVVYK